jgi:hypothetical protein
MLTGVLVAFTGRDPRTGKDLPNIDASINLLWNAFSRHYGKEQESQMVPMIGEEKVWKRPHTLIRMLRTTFPQPSLLVSYEPIKTPK